MSDTDILFQVLKSFDSAIALGIALWIINIGIKRMDMLQAQYKDTMIEVISQQRENNRTLMGLVESLCIQPTHTVAESPKLPPTLQASG